jgi:hypothetical protein
MISSVSFVLSSLSLALSPTYAITYVDTVLTHKPNNKVFRARSLVLVSYCSSVDNSK